MHTALLTGGTGFIGQALMEQLKTDRFNGTIRLFSRKGSTSKLPDGVESYTGDVSSYPDLVSAMAGVDTIFHLTGILAETRTQTYEKVHVQGTRSMLKAAKMAGVKTIIAVSAIGASHSAQSRYHKTKAVMEDEILSSGLDVSIVRPSVVFGRRDKFINLFAGLARGLHILPLIGSGQNLVHPIWVGDLVTSLSKLNTDRTIKPTILEIGGPRIYTYRELMETIKSSLKVNALIMSQPPSMLAISAFFQEKLLPTPFLTREMIRMALSDNVAKENHLVTVLNVSPYPLEAYLEANARP
jgi:NADH dehydrogenase